MKQLTKIKPGLLSVMSGLEPAKVFNGRIHSGLASHLSTHCVACGFHLFEDYMERADKNSTYIMKRVGSLIDIVCYQRVNTYGNKKEENNNSRAEIS